jgi:hypothetical protein
VHLTKIGDYKVDFLGEYWSILKKALTHVPGALGELFDEKNQRSKISCQGPFKQYSMALKFDLLIQRYAILILRYTA